MERDVSPVDTDKFFFAVLRGGSPNRSKSASRKQGQTFESQTSAMQMKDFLNSKYFQEF